MILISARAQEQAREHPDSGEFEQARKLLPEAADELRTIAPTRARAHELLEQAETLDRKTDQNPSTPIERRRSGR